MKPLQRRSAAKYLAIAAVSLVFACDITRTAEVAHTAPATISDAVEDELMVDPGVPGYAIDVITTDGIVTLSGSVENVLAKERAGYIAETVKGVRAVVNRIQVNPAVDRSDADIKRDVELALAADPATDSYQVDVKVSANRVQLTGRVDSWAERELSATVAKGVKGVVAVDNLIAVAYKSLRTDAEIKPDIEQRMRWDALLDDGLIEVAVTGGKVSLSGTVGSAAEKRRARADAFVAGVQSVDDSKLEVARWARDEDLRQDKYAIRSDDEIRRAIERAWRFDPRVQYESVQATVEQGRAILYGNVDSLIAKQAAAQDARNTIGVVRVDNRIDIIPQTDLPDEYVKRLVRNAIDRDPQLESDDFEVKITRGLAILQGRVDSAYERSRAENVVSTVPGVIQVDNRLKVARDHRLLYDPFTYDPYPYDVKGYRPFERYTHKSDSQLKRDVREKLRRSPYVNAERVSVEVDNGRVHLTGMVNSWREFSAASNDALEAGAISVVNDLVVVLK